MSTTEREEWRGIRGTDWYEVSSLGRVRSWAPRGKTPPKAPRILAQNWATSNGTVRQLAVMLKVDGRCTHRLVRVLVAREFLSAESAIHIDGDPTNNRASNLAPTSGMAETASLQRDGTLDVIAVEAIYLDDRDNASVAAEYGIAPTMVSAIRTGRKWGTFTGGERRERPRGRWTDDERADIGTSHLTVPELCERWGISPSRVGQLRRSAWQVVRGIRAADRRANEKNPSPPKR